MPPNPWDQLEDEPPEAYVRFLIYRNLGPARTVDLAYSAYLAQMPSEPSAAAKRRGGKKPPGPKAQSRATGVWWADSSAYDWKNRATAWDVYHFANVVPDGAIAIMSVVAETAKVALRALEAGTLRPRTWGELIDGVQLLTSFVSADTVSHLLAGRAGPVLPAGDEGQGAVDASEGTADGRP